MKTIFKTILAAIVALVVVSAWISNGTQQSSSSVATQSAPAEEPVQDAVPASDAVVAQEDVPVQEAPKPVVQPPIEISALDLFNAYQANEVKADAQYKGHRLAVTGTVSRIGKDIMDKPFVSLATTNEFETVNAYFSKDKIDELSKLNKGESVTVTCRGNGMIIGSPLLDCDN